MLRWNFLYFSLWPLLLILLLGTTRGVWRHPLGTHLGDTGEIPSVFLETSYVGLGGISGNEAAKLLNICLT